MPEFDKCFHRGQKVKISTNRRRKFLTNTMAKRREEFESANILKKATVKQISSDEVDEGPTSFVGLTTPSKNHKDDHVVDSNDAQEESPCNVAALLALRTSRLEVRTEEMSTVLFVQIRGFSAACSNMKPTDIADSIAEIDEYVRATAAELGAKLIEQRTGCFLCIFSSGKSSPEGGSVSRDDNVKSAKALAASLYANWTSFSLFGRAGDVVMGMASGPVTLLGAYDDGGVWAPLTVLAVRGGPADVAVAAATKELGCVP